MRILLSKKSRLKLLGILKNKNKVNTLKELASSMSTPFKTLNQWIYGHGYISEKILPTNFEEELEVIDKQEDNWGQIKAGKIGGKESVKKLKMLLTLPKYKKMRSEAGKKTMGLLWKKYGADLEKMATRGKIRKRENKSKMLEKENENYFTNE